MNFSLRKFHRQIGILLLLPFITWSGSAIFFLFRPAYSEAYESPVPRLLPLNTTDWRGDLTGQQQWLEVRQLRTVLGNHLLLKNTSGWQHINADNGQVWPEPAPAQVETLLADAFSQNPQRYGEIININGLTVQTSTGVTATLNWPGMSIYQQGRDTYWIDKVYDIHYLRWTGIRAIDNIVGLIGLLLLILSSLIGLLMILKSSGQNKNE